MAPRILNITACCFVAVWPTALHGQGPDAQSVTQSLLDQHKSADPTNSARSLTGRSQEFDISKIPPPKARPRTTQVSPRDSRRIRELEEKKKQFLKEEMKKQSTQAQFFALDATPAQRKANQDSVRIEAERNWENKPDAKTLRRLKAEVAKASKARRETEFDISDIPLPRSNLR